MSTLQLPFLLRGYPIIFFILIVLLPNAACAKEDFEIKHADSLETDNQVILIKGNINIEYKDAKIEAPEGKIETTKKGEPYIALFTNRAKLQLKDRRLEADKISVLIQEKKIIAEGNVNSELKDKKQVPIIISSDYQELFWSGENANIKGNIVTKYQDIKITSDEAKIIYKNKAPVQAVFTGISKQANLIQPTNSTLADNFLFDIKTHNVQANGNVISTIWPDKIKPVNEQDFIHLGTEELYIDDLTGTITAKADKKKVNLNYQTTQGKSQEAKLLRNNNTKNPEKIIFIGNADVSQDDKQLQSEEIILNFDDKKLTSNTKTNIRPKTLIFKR